MPQFVEEINNKQIYFSKHSLDRWCQRLDIKKFNSRAEAFAALKKKLKNSEVTDAIPDWSDVNNNHRSKADHFIKLDSESGFVINKNPTGDFVAVTFIDKLNESN